MAVSAVAILQVAMYFFGFLRLLTLARTREASESQTQRPNDSGTDDISEVSALGGSPRKVVSNATDPTWTPDGQALVYLNITDAQIWTSGVEGESPHVLVHTLPQYMGAEPRVSPDGKMVAFAARGLGGRPYGELGIADVAYVGRDGRLIYRKNGEAQAFDPRAGTATTLGKVPANPDFLRSSSKRQLHRLRGHVAARK